MTRVLSCVILTTLWLCAGCQLFDFRSDLDKATDAPASFIRSVAAGDARKAYARLDTRCREDLPYSQFQEWVSQHRSDYQALASQPDLGVRSVVRQDSLYYATVMVSGRAQTWEIHFQDGLWRLNPALQ